MRSKNIKERTQVLLVNTPCLHLHSFCATDVGSGPANYGNHDSSVTTEITGVYYTGMNLLLISSRTTARDCCYITFQVAHSVPSIPHAKG
jgi:hypothetical protein